MIAILNRWRQFGRRHFWPHLLLGMIAASFGVPSLENNSDHSSAAQTAASSQNYVYPADYHKSVLWQESPRRSSFNIDYWHQHAIRAVIRHLSFAMAPQTLPSIQEEISFKVAHLALLDSLNALLTQQAKPSASVHNIALWQSPTFIAFTVTTAMCQAQGIRAGPHRFS